MSKGPDMDHYIGVFDNVITEEECTNLINRFENINNNASFLTSDGSHQFGSSLGRKDQSLFFERVAPQEAGFIQENVGKCMEAYTKTYIGLQGERLSSSTCKVQRTPPSGGYHVWHSEHGGDQGSMRRAAVWILYLSTHHGSGETEFLQQGIRVAPQAGRVVIWPASYTHPHRGNPVYGDADKYIATGWYEHYYDVLNEVKG